MIKEIYLSFYKKYWKYYIFYYLSIITIPARQIMIPHFYSKIIDKLKSREIKDATKQLGVLLLVWIAIQFMGLAKEKVHSITWPKFNYHAQESILKKIIDGYSNNFQELKVGEILTKLIKLPWILENIQDEVGRIILNHLIITISNVAYLMYNSVYLGLFYMAVMLIYVLISYYYIKTCTHYKIKSEKQYDHSHGYIEDVISNLLTVYSSNRRSEELNSIHNINQDNIQLEITRQFSNLKYKVIYNLLNIVVFIGLNGISIYLFQKNLIDIQKLVAIFILTFSILNSLIMYFDASKSIVGILGDLKYMKEFTTTLPPAESAESDQLINNISDGIEITLKNIEYKVPNRTIYESLNLNINKNESILITGHIGSGKSTFAKLIVKLIKPTGGEVTINGVNIDRLSTKNIRKNIIYIPQNPILFDRTLKENITYGLPLDKVNEHSIFELMESIGLDELKTKFGEMMNKPVGKRGSILSGGQRQIVWILRALLSDIKIIILDEPTSALDKCTKELIINVLKKIIENNVTTPASENTSNSNIGKHSVIIITHDHDVMNEIKFDSLIRFKDGRAIKCKYDDTTDNKYSFDEDSNVNNEDEYGELKCENPDCNNNNI